MATVSDRQPLAGAAFQRAAAAFGRDGRSSSSRRLLYPGGYTVNRHSPHT